MLEFQVGQEVVFRPLPSYGISWTRETLVDGVAARVTQAHEWPNGSVSYAVQRRDVGNHPYHDCHWACTVDELEALVTVKYDPNALPGTPGNPSTGGTRTSVIAA